MLSDTENTVRFFQSKEAVAISNDYVCYAVVSKVIRDSTKPNGMRFENWKARFVGEACQKCRELKNKDLIILNCWEITNEVNSDGVIDYYMIIKNFRKK